MKIKAVVKNPGEACRVKQISNTLKSLQKLVGGPIQMVPWVDGMVIICNEEGNLQNLPVNIRLRNYIFVGVLVIVGTDGDEFTDVPDWILEILERKSSHRCNGTGAKGMNKFILCLDYKS